MGLLAGRTIFRSVESVSAGQSEASQRSPGKVSRQSAVVDELLKFRSRCLAVAQWMRDDLAPTTLSGNFALPTAVVES